ncbi:MAG: hypothetical protein V9E93_17560 [Steroidobacteraceae bacterium]|nr:hypothetical protein [Pseudomonadota bacterium]
MTPPIVTTGLLVGLILWLGMALLVGVLIGRRSDRAWLGVLTAVVIFILPIWDLPFGLAMYKRYVEDLGGTRVFRTVEADGYLQSPGHTLDLVVQTLRGARAGSAGRAAFPYSYYEAHFDRGSSGDFIQEAGFYEIRLADRGSPECEQFESWPRARQYRDYRHLQELCVVAIRRNEPRSRYERDSPYYRQALPGPSWLPPVWAVWTRFLDRETGQVLAQQYELRYESWFPMPHFDEARPLTWLSRDPQPLRTTDVIKPIMSDKE